MMTQATDQLKALRPTKVGLQILAWSALWKGLEGGLYTLLGVGGANTSGAIDLTGLQIVGLAAAGASAGAILRVVLNYVGVKAASAA